MCVLWAGIGARFETWWSVQDPTVVVLLALCVILRWLWGQPWNVRFYSIVCVILIIETCVDVSLNRKFYLPTQTDAAPSTVDVKPGTVYFAGPLFTQAEWSWNAKIIDDLRRGGCHVFAPQEHAKDMLSGTKPFDPRAVFEMNRSAIDRCDVLVAILDGSDSDSGTAWECGYAVKSGRPVIGVRTDLRAGGDDPKAAINLMLARSCADLVALPVAKRTDEAWVADKIVKAVYRVRKSQK